MTQHLLEDFDSGIVTLTLNRPERRNAFSSEMLLALLDAVRRAALAPEVRLVVLTGRGGAFCAGGDVKDFAGNAKRSAASSVTFEQRVAELRNVANISRYLHEMPKPTLAIIPGAAAGAGLSIALACDLRIASTDARFTTAFAKVGLSGDFGCSYFLTHIVGTAKARELLFSGEVLSAERALQLGLVSQVCEPNDLSSRARVLAQSLSHAPTLALGHMKRNLNSALTHSLGEVLDIESQNMVRSFQTEDHDGAAKAFTEKRVPDFAGR